MLTKQMLNIEKIKQDFPILTETVNNHPLIYLDNSATTQKPEQVIKALETYYKTSNANVHRGLHKLSEKATMAYEEAHQVVADFINADFQEIIFTKGTTESLNLLAYALCKGLEEGDEIVLTEMEHHSNIVPWQQLAKEKGLVLKFIPIKDDFTLDMIKANEIITDKTKIVSVTHMSNVLGTINPVKELADLAHQKGAKIIIDAAQSVPHMHVNVKDLDCDFLTFSGHKMLAPTGIGVLYGKKELLENMQPFNYGGDMILEVTFEDSTWNELPWKFEAGTPNISGAVGLATAIKYLQKIGLNNIQEYEEDLTEYALEKLKTVEGLKLFGPEKNRGAVFSFDVEGIHPHDMSQILDRYGVAIRGGHHCAMPLMSVLKVNGTSRASFYLYNTKEDVDKLVAGINKAKEIFK